MAEKLRLKFTRLSRLGVEFADVQDQRSYLKKLTDAVKDASKGHASSDVSLALDKFGFKAGWKHELMEEVFVEDDQILPLMKTVSSEAFKQCKDCSTTNLRAAAAYRTAIKGLLEIACLPGITATAGNVSDHPHVSLVLKYLLEAIKRGALEAEAEARSGECLAQDKATSGPPSETALSLWLRQGSVDALHQVRQWNTLFGLRDLEGGKRDQLVLKSIFEGAAMAAKTGTALDALTTGPGEDEADSLLGFPLAWTRGGTFLTLKSAMECVTEPVLSTQFIDFFCSVLQDQASLEAPGLNRILSRGDSVGVVPLRWSQDVLEGDLESADAHLAGVAWGKVEWCVFLVSSVRERELAMEEGAEGESGAPVFSLKLKSGGGEAAKVGQLKHEDGEAAGVHGSAPPPACIFPVLVRLKQGCSSIECWIPEATSADEESAVQGASMPPDPLITQHNVATFLPTESEVHAWATLCSSLAEGMRAAAAAAATSSGSVPPHDEGAPGENDSRKDVKGADADGTLPEEKLQEHAAPVEPVLVIHRGFQGIPSPSLSSLGDFSADFALSLVECLLFAHLSPRTGWPLSPTTRLSRLLDALELAPFRCALLEPEGEPLQLGQQRQPAAATGGCPTNGEGETGSLLGAQGWASAMTAASAAQKQQQASFLYPSVVAARTPGPTAAGDNSTPLSSDSMPRSSTFPSPLPNLPLGPTSLLFSSAVAGLPQATSGGSVTLAGTPVSSFVGLASTSPASAASTAPSQGVVGLPAPLATVPHSFRASQSAASGTTISTFPWLTPEWVSAATHAGAVPMQIDRSWLAYADPSFDLAALPCGVEPPPFMYSLPPHLHNLCWAPVLPHLKKGLQFTTPPDCSVAMVYAYFTGGSVLFRSFMSLLQWDPLVGDPPRGGGAGPGGPGEVAQPHSVNGRSHTYISNEYGLLPRPEEEIVFTEEILVLWKSFQTLVAEERPSILSLLSSSLSPKFASWDLEASLYMSAPCVMSLIREGCVRIATGPMRKRLKAMTPERPEYALKTGSILRDLRMLVSSVETGRKRELWLNAIGQEVDRRLQLGRVSPDACAFEMGSLEYPLGFVVRAKAEGGRRKRKFSGMAHLGGGGQPHSHYGGTGGGGGHEAFPGGGGSARVVSPVAGGARAHGVLVPSIGGANGGDGVLQITGRQHAGMEAESHAIMEIAMSMGREEAGPTVVEAATNPASFAEPGNGQSGLGSFGGREEEEEEEEEMEVEEEERDEEAEEEQGYHNLPHPQHQVGLQGDRELQAFEGAEGEEVEVDGESQKGARGHKDEVTGLSEELTGEKGDNDVAAVVNDDQAKGVVQDSVDPPVVDQQIPPCSGPPGDGSPVKPPESFETHNVVLIGYPHSPTASAEAAAVVQPVGTTAGDSQGCESQGPPRGRKKRAIKKRAEEALHLGENYP